MRKYSGFGLPTFRAELRQLFGNLARAATIEELRKVLRLGSVKDAARLYLFGRICARESASDIAIAAINKKTDLSIVRCSMVLLTSLNA